jgi:hypothetical protein
VITQAAKEVFALRRMLFVFAAVCATALLAVPVAFGALTFHSGPTFSINSQGQLECQADVSGLGNATSTPATCSADSSTATYQCFNNGGNHPKAGNKETVTAPVSTTVNIPVRNGRAQADITTGPPGPGTFSCPSGQSLFLVSVSYTNPTFTIQGQSFTQEGTISRTNLMVPVG